MNNRPLGIFSKPGTDPLDGGPITPNHLLLGRASNKIPELQFSNMSNTKRIWFLKSIVDEFWFKWQVVAFHSLVPQYKWHKSQRDIQIGDIVILKEDHSKVGDYRLGQVMETKISEDGHTRSASVKVVFRGADGSIKKNTLS